MDWSELFLRLGLAAAAGAAVGANRDLFGKPTGVRLHALVALGSAVAVLAGADGDDEAAVSRIIQGVVGGVGFLGAGVILHGSARGGLDVRNMTTAASVWVTATLGVAAGVGQWRLLVVATLAATIILLALLPVDRALFGRFRENERGDDEAP